MDRDHPSFLDPGKVRRRSTRRARVPRRENVQKLPQRLDDPIGCNRLLPLISLRLAWRFENNSERESSALAADHIL